MKINDKNISTFKPKDKKYSISDNGLILTVYPNGRKTFSIRQMIKGTRKNKLLGSYPNISVKDARKLHEQFYISREEQLVIADRFSDLCKVYLSDKKEKVQSIRYRAVNGIIHNYLLPSFGNYLVNKISAFMLFNVVSKLDVTNRTKQSIINVAKEVFNVAFMLGQLEKNPIPNDMASMFPAEKTEHRKAIEIDAIGDLYYMYDFVEKEYCNAFEFCLRSMLRIGEVINLELSFVDVESMTVTIPAEKMKMKREFVFPLTEQMKNLINFQNKKFCFEINQKQLAQRTVNAKFKTCPMCKEIDIHGFRATARTWLANEGVQFEVSEMCLSHTEKSAVVRTYNRSTYLEQRRPVMQKWNDLIDDKFRLAKKQSAPGSTLKVV